MTGGVIRAYNHGRWVASRRAHKSCRCRSAAPPRFSRAGSPHVHASPTTSLSNRDIRRLGPMQIIRHFRLSYSLPTALMPGKGVTDRRTRMMRSTPYARESGAQIRRHSSRSCARRRHRCGTHLRNCSGGRARGASTLQDVERPRPGANPACACRTGTARLRRRAELRRRAACRPGRRPCAAASRAGRLLPAAVSRGPAESVA
jgi:hypothetical protein